MEIGFIGLGNMGSGMVANLLKAGHHVTVYNRSPAKAEALVQQGATAAHDRRSLRRRGRVHYAGRRPGYRERDVR